MREVFETMGTVVSVASPDPIPTDALARVRAEFAERDRRFSLYDPGSELSAIASGRIRLIEATEQTRDVYAECLAWRDRTAGAFTPHRPDGALDLSGIVKALAIEAAGAALDAAGCAEWSIDAGGDVLQRAETAVAGIADPDAPGALLVALPIALPRRAVATSGSAERGDHIWGRARHDLRQATVIANDIVTADVLATAIVAGGRETLDLATRDFEIDVLAVTSDGGLLATPALRR